MTSKKGMLIVYSGPSGVGKGTLIEPIARERDMFLSVSVTTREPRPGELDGVNYHFLSQHDFDRMAAQGGLLEYACYNSNCYGTPRKNVEEAIGSGQDVLLEIDVQGAMQIRDSFPEAVFIFVMPPSLDALKERLKGRGTETGEEIDRRIALAAGEISMSCRYDYIIVNDDISKAREHLRSVIDAAHLRAAEMKDYVNEVIGV